MANKHNYLFNPSSPDHLTTYALIAESEQDAKQQLLAFGFTENEMTDSYAESDYADCFRLRKCGTFPRDAQWIGFSNSCNFWENSNGVFELIKESDDFDELLIFGVKQFAHREIIGAHWNLLQTVFWIRDKHFAFRIAENKSYKDMIGDNCFWKLDRETRYKYSIAKCDYNKLKRNVQKYEH